MAVEASIVVVFAEGTTAQESAVIVEFDPLDDNNLDSDGDVKSIFNASIAPVDTPGLLINHDPALTITDIKCTSGNISRVIMAVTQVREVPFVFGTLETKAAIGYSRAVLSSTIFYGNQATVTASGSDLVVTGEKLPCVGVATMNVTFQEKCILTPPFLPDLGADANYPIVVFIYVS